jgi:hypothetical protein
MKKCISIECRMKAEDGKKFIGAQVAEDTRV